MSSNQEQTESVQPTKFCFSFFSKGNCEGGAACKYSHDEEKYMTEKGLKHCPKCDLFCKNTSKICSKCVKVWLENPREPRVPKEVRPDIPLKECPRGCGNMCRETSNSCKQCVSDWLKRKEEREEREQLRRDEFNNREEQNCSGYNCTNKSKYSLCKPCHDVSRAYVARR